MYTRSPARSSSGSYYYSGNSYYGYGGYYGYYPYYRASLGLATPPLASGPLPPPASVRPPRPSADPLLCSSPPCGSLPGAPGSYRYRYQQRVAGIGSKIIVVGCYFQVRPSTTRVSHVSSRPPHISPHLPWLLTPYLLRPSQALSSFLKPSLTLVAVGCSSQTPTCFPCGGGCYAQPGNYNVSWEYQMPEPVDQYEVSEGMSFTPPLRSDATGMRSAQTRSRA